jgi:hypothetical protein
MAAPRRAPTTSSGIGTVPALVIGGIGLALAVGGGSCAYSTGYWNGEDLWAPRAMMLGLLVLVAGLAIMGWAAKSR